ncbi:MAG: BlaI/MecI/CopY family transcriptional regulator [Oscillospiraceae bacterium]|nr:MAG: BlaI/MecI/CopY family transcriptional regulator [Oscillospiraceae bacterium]
MELIWAHEPISAKELSVLADQEFGWNKNTTYTVIKKLRQRGTSDVMIPVLFVFH